MISSIGELGERLRGWVLLLGFIYALTVSAVIDCRSAKLAIAGPEFLETQTIHESDGFRVQVLPQTLTWQPFTLQVELRADPSSPPIVGYVENLRIRFETPKGNRYVFLSQWDMMKNLGKLDLLHKSLNNASKSMRDVLNGLESPGSLAAIYQGSGLRPGLTEILDGVYTQRVIIGRVLEQWRRDGEYYPTLEMVVRRSANVVLGKLSQQHDEIASLGSDTRLKNFLDHFDQTFEKISHDIDKAVRALASSPCAGEEFDRSNPAHVSWITKVLNRLQGDSGELMFAIRVESFQAKGVPIAKFPADAATVKETEADIRYQALRFYWLRLQLSTFLQSKRVDLSRPAHAIEYIETHSAEISAALKTREPANFEEALNPGQQLEAKRQWVESRFGITLRSIDAFDVSYQRLVKLQAEARQQEINRDKIYTYLKELKASDANYALIDLESETDRYMDKEIDLIFAGSDYWAEVKNYSSTITLKMLTHHRQGEKSILDQATENVHLARAIMGPSVKVFQFSTKGFTLEAAVELQRVGVTILESSIVFPDK